MTPLQKGQGQNFTLIKLTNIIEINLQDVNDLLYRHKTKKEKPFSRIDETVFSVLYSEKASRSNLPVNIYVSLEILKELFGLSDEELLDRFHFDNLFIFAMGLNRVGERTISERALYYMRRRVVEYEEKTGINLFDKRYNDSEYVKKCKLRPAIEGTMFQMKLHLRNGKSKYRGKIKVKCSSIVRSMAINFKRAYAYRLKKALSYYICKNISRFRSFLFRKNSFILCNA